jgi:hypothetical protein
VSDLGGAGQSDRSVQHGKDVAAVTPCPPLRRQRGGGVWTAADLSEPGLWSMDLPAAVVDAPAPFPGLQPARADGVADLAVSDGTIPAEWGWRRSALRAFDALNDDVERRLGSGPGFVVLRGFPVAEWGPLGAAALFARVIARRGGLLAQNTAGQRLYLVRTRGGGPARQYGSRGSGELLFHTDQAAAPPDEMPTSLGLLCLQQAAEGGVTRLASAHRLVNGLLERDRALAEALRAPAPFARDPDGVSSAPPVDASPIMDDGAGVVRVRFNRYFMEVGARQTGRPLPDGVVAALDALDRLLADPAAAHEVLLAPGDALVADNGLVLHNRTAYVDDTDHRRCLVRAWARRAQP